MKSIIYLFLMLPFFSYSQKKISLEDFIGDSKEKNKKERIGYESNQNEQINYIANIFDDNIFKITHYYGLQKGKDIYGQDGKDYYGFSSGLAFAIDGKLWMQQSILRPWSTDESYQEYAEDYQAASVSLKLSWLKEQEQDNEVTLKSKEYDIRSEQEGAIGYMELDENVESYFDTAIESQSSGALILYNIAEGVIRKEVIFCSPVWEDGKGRVKVLDDYKFDAGIYLHFSGQNAVLSFTAAGIVDGGVIVPISSDLVPEDTSKPKEEKKADSKPKKSKGKLQKIKK